MYHVVIGIDDDAEHTLICIGRVAKLPGEPDEKEMVLVHSFTDSPGGASATQTHSVREAGEFLGDRDIEYDINESSDDPAEVITEFADEEDAGPIVTTRRRRSPAGKALFGSVTQTVIPNPDHPVMVTGSTERKR